MRGPRMLVGPQEAGIVVVMDVVMVVLAAMVDVEDVVMVVVTVWVVAKVLVTETLDGRTVDVDVLVVVTVEVYVGVVAVTVEVGLTAMIFSVYMMVMYLVPKIIQNPCKESL